MMHHARFAAAIALFVIAMIGVSILAYRGGYLFGSDFAASETEAQQR